TALRAPSVVALKITSTPASAPLVHFMLTAHSSCHGNPVSGISVITGFGWLTGTRRSSTTLLPLKQMAPYLNVNGLMSHLLSVSGMVGLFPNPQVPLFSRLLNNIIGKPVRPMMAAVLTLASAAWSAAKEVSAPPAGAEATCLLPGFSCSPLSLA